MDINETVYIAQFEVTEADLNYLGILFGGKLLAEIDINLDQSVHKFTPEKTVTGSVDKVRFIKPSHLGDTITIKSFVSGNSGRVIEVSCKVYGPGNELRAYGVLEYIVVNKEAKLPSLTASTTLGNKLIAGFEQRLALQDQYHREIFTELEEIDAGNI